MTVDRCHKHAFNYVIVETVSPGERNYSIGFFTKFKQMNVASSRIKHELIIIHSQDMKKVIFANNGAKAWASIIQDQGSLVTMTVA